MDLLVEKSAKLTGSVKVPANKSHSFRALIMSALGRGTSRIVAPAVSNDWTRGTEALRMFGARISEKEDQLWEITGTGGELNTPDDVIDCGNSGILLRFIMGLAACCDGYSVLTGDESLRHIRPAQPLIDAINALGGWAVSTKGDGHAPVVVRGKLSGGSVEMDGTDSQPISSLLIAAGLIDSPIELVVRNPGEKPWIGLTLSWLDRVGVRYTNDNYERYSFEGGARWDAFDVTIPLDWSAGLYPIVAALLTPGSEVRLEGMDFNDPQGDKAVVDVLREMGGDIEVTADTVIARSSELIGREIDCNDFIDQFMLLAVVAARAKGETVLTNAAICRHKECDRITEMHNALKAMHADVAERPDGLVVRQSNLRGAKLDSHADHRMVMTLTVAALLAEGQTLISDVECVKKTFPDFVNQMKNIGCNLQIQQPPGTRNS